MDCIFCKIVNGEIPCHKIYENERALVFLDIQPGCEGHTLVIPKAHASDIFELSEADLGAIAAAAKHVAPALMEVTGADGLNLHQSNGEAAGQVIFHFHLHLLPRKRDDDLRGPWRPKSVEAEALAALAKRLQRSLQC